MVIEKEAVFGSHDTVDHKVRDAIDFDVVALVIYRSITLEELLIEASNHKRCERRIDKLVDKYQQE